MPARVAEQLATLVGKEGKLMPGFLRTKSRGGCVHYDISSLAQCFLASTELWVPAPVPCKRSVEIPAFNPSTWEVKAKASKVQRHP